MSHNYTAPVINAARKIRGNERGTLEGYIALGDAVLALVKDGHAPNQQRAIALAERWIAENPETAPLKLARASIARACRIARNHDKIADCVTIRQAIEATAKPKVAKPSAAKAASAERKAATALKTLTMDPAAYGAAIIASIEAAEPGFRKALVDRLKAAIADLSNTDGQPQTAPEPAKAAPRAKAKSKMIVVPAGTEAERLTAEMNARLALNDLGPIDLGPNNADGERQVTWNGTAYYNLDEAVEDAKAAILAANTRKGGLNVLARAARSASSSPH